MVGKGDMHDDIGHYVALGIRSDEMSCDLTGRLGYHSDGDIHSGTGDTSSMGGVDTSATDGDGREVVSLR